MNFYLLSVVWSRGIDFILFILLKVEQQRIQAEFLLFGMQLRYFYKVGVVVSRLHQLYIK